MSSRPDDAPTPRDDAKIAVVVEDPRKKPENSGRTLPRSVFALFCIGVSGLYIINPTAGLLELIPDAFPIVGNLDEAAAAALMLAGLRYFGLDLTALLMNRDRLDR